MRRPVLHNGVNDPGILKAVFLAGGPGSGKSYAVSQLFAIPKDATALMTSPTGLKLVNSDPFFEHNLRRMGIDPKVLAKLPPEDFAALTEGPDSPRGRAKTTREAFLRHWTDGRLGLILDGTGDDFEKIRNQSERLRSLGYDTMMVFVNTSLDVAKKRNRQRARSLPDSLVEEIWNAVQENLGAFQDYFGRDNIIIVDATVAGPPSEHLIAAAEAFVRRPIRNRIGKAWIAAERSKAATRSNPTGFRIKQSMLDWQIIDANGKPVPGKRFPFKADAERELARLNAGAVAIESAPVPAPTPAPARVTADYRAREAQPSTSALARGATASPRTLAPVCLKMGSRDPSGADLSLGKRSDGRGWWFNVEGRENLGVALAIVEDWSRTSTVYAYLAVVRVLPAPAYYEVLNVRFFENFTPRDSEGVTLPDSLLLQFLTSQDRLTEDSIDYKPRKVSSSYMMYTWEYAINHKVCSVEVARLIEDALVSAPIQRSPRRGMPWDMRPPYSHIDEMLNLVEQEYSRMGRSSRDDGRGPFILDRDSDSERPFDYDYD
jgi:hypothetical protein